MERSIFSDETALAAFCERNGIRRLSLFGSRLKGTAREDSDVDLLVEFFPESIPGLFGIVRMENTLSEMLGAKVDLRIAGDLSRFFRDEVVAMAEPQYVAPRPLPHASYVKALESVVRQSCSRDRHEEPVSS